MRTKLTQAQDHFRVRVYRQPAFDSKIDNRLNACAIRHARTSASNKPTTDKAQIARIAEKAHWAKCADPALDVSDVDAELKEFFASLGKVRRPGLRRAKQMATVIELRQRPFWAKRDNQPPVRQPNQASRTRE